MPELTISDWRAAESHLREVREAYQRQLEAPGVQPLLGLDEITRLEARLQAGERTPELYREIMALNY